MVVKVVKFAPKLVASAKKKKTTKPSHPPTSQIVVAAIKSLKERNGSSLHAIKKYISTSYKIDADKLAPFIKKFLKNAVTSGKLIQTKGKGASGSFKLPNKVEKKVKPKKATKKPTAKKVKKVKAAKVKAKKPKKAAVSKKPKSLKPKKVVGVKKASPKKK